MMSAPTTIIHPQQPFFVLNSRDYYKKMAPQCAVSHFYGFNCQEHLTVTNGAVPDGATDIIFSCQDGVPTAILAGSAVSGMQNIFVENGGYFGVRLLPGSMDHFGSISARELINQRVDFAEVTNRPDIVEKISRQTDFKGKIALFAEAFPEVMQNPDSRDGSATLVHEILSKIYESGGNIHVQELEKELHYSRRHLLRVFKEFTGIDIKRFCRIVRFQALIARMNQENRVLLSEFSAEAGYYDQNHFQKDFRDFAGMTPGNYVRLIQENDYQKRITLL